MVASKGVYCLAPHLYDVLPPWKGVCPLAVALGRGHGTLESVFPDIPDGFQGPHRENLTFSLCN